MRVLVTGSAGHLGEALVRTLRERSIEVRGLDLLPSAYTTDVGSICDSDFVARCMRGVDVLMHSATLHKPHVATHSESAFVRTNIEGTLNLLEAARDSRVSSVAFTSTTSVFGATLVPEENQPAAWITEEAGLVPKNIYGVTKAAAESLCELFYRAHGVPCVVLRTSRFFMDDDDDPDRHKATGGERFEDLNLKANEYLYRRLDLADAVEAHILAAERAPELGFARYIVSATTPFERSQLEDLRGDATDVVRTLYPHYEQIFARRGWSMFREIDRVYVNRRAREELGWQPRFDFCHILQRLGEGQSLYSDLARSVGIKDYHPSGSAFGVDSRLQP